MGNAQLKEQARGLRFEFKNAYLKARRKSSFFYLIIILFLGGNNTTFYKLDKCFNYVFKSIKKLNGKIPQNMP